MSTLGAPMPKKEEDLIDTKLVLYTYLVCLSGLALCPPNTRMFQQKNLNFAEITRSTGLARNTARRHLYELENKGKVRYKGSRDNDNQEACFQDGTELSENWFSLPKNKRRELIDAEISRVWNLRKKNRDGVYLIPRPDPSTPIPEQTLECLIKQFKCTEEEIQLYLFCAAHHDQCCYLKQDYKVITFEMIKSGLEKKNSSSYKDRDIRMGLCFLKAIGLIDFTEGTIRSQKGAIIPSFKLNSVKFYVNYEVKEFKKDELLSEDEYFEILNRISD